MISDGGVGTSEVCLLVSGLERSSLPVIVLNREKIQDFGGAD